MGNFKKALVTGSSGLTGSEMVNLLLSEGWEVIGIDANIRSKMLGSDSTNSIESLLKEKGLKSYNVDIRNYEDVKDVFTTEGPFEFIVHAAAQPAHEWSIDNTIEDFYINAVGTINVLECYRKYSKQCPFIYVSSSKVSGDSVNNLDLIELDTRFDLGKYDQYYQGVDEDFCRIDGKGKSYFGNSKACGDLTAQEYMCYDNLQIGIFRPVCITGSAHKGSPLHGYLSYLAKCVATDTKYIINGYKGKQVRDNIHAKDLVKAFYEFYKNPIPDVYNIGAGRESNNSILEALTQFGNILGKDPIYEFSDVVRKFDHKWCIYSAKKFRTNYPNWSIEYNNDLLMNEICKQYGL